MAAMSRVMAFIYAAPELDLQKDDGAMDDLNAMLEPGQIVSHPAQPDWGQGQVQSNINGKLTVMFEQEGKVVIDSRRVAVRPVFK